MDKDLALLHQKMDYLTEQTVYRIILTPIV